MPPKSGIAQAIEIETAHLKKLLGNMSTKSQITAASNYDCNLVHSTPDYAVKLKAWEAHIEKEGEGREIIGEIWLYRTLGEISSFFIGDAQVGRSTVDKLSGLATVWNVLILEGGISLLPHYQAIRINDEEIGSSADRLRAYMEEYKSKMNFKKWTLEHMGRLALELYEPVLKVREQKGSFPVIAPVDDVPEKGPAMHLVAKSNGAHRDSIVTAGGYEVGSVTLDGPSKTWPVSPVAVALEGGQTVPDAGRFIAQALPMLGEGESRSQVSSTGAIHHPPGISFQLHDTQQITMAEMDLAQQLWRSFDEEFNARWKGAGTYSYYKLSELQEQAEWFCRFGDNCKEALRSALLKLPPTEIAVTESTPRSIAEADASTTLQDKKIACNRTREALTTAIAGMRDYKEFYRKQLEGALTLEEKEHMAWTATQVKAQMGKLRDFGVRSEEMMNKDLFQPLEKMLQAQEDLNMAREKVQAKEKAGADAKDNKKTEVRGKAKEAR